MQIYQTIDVFFCHRSMRIFQSVRGHDTKIADCICYIIFDEFKVLEPSKYTLERIYSITLSIII